MLRLQIWSVNPRARLALREGEEPVSSVEVLLLACGYAGLPVSPSRLPYAASVLYIEDDAGCEEPRIWTNTPPFREDHKNMVQILFEEAKSRASVVACEGFILVLLDDISPWSSYLFCSHLFSWMTSQPCAFCSVQTSARWPCGSFSQASPSQSSFCFGCLSPFKWGASITMDPSVTWGGTYPIIRNVLSREKCLLYTTC